MTCHESARADLAKQYAANMEARMADKITDEAWSAEIERLADAAYSYAREHNITGLDRAEFIRGVHRP